MALFLVLIAVLLSCEPSYIAAVGCDSDTPCQRAPLPSALLSQWRPASSEAEVILRLRCRIACEEEIRAAEDTAPDESTGTAEAELCAAECLRVHFSQGVAATDRNSSCSAKGCLVYHKYIQDSSLGLPIITASTDSILEVSPSTKSTALVAEYTIHIPTPNLTLWNNSDIVYLLQVVNLDEDNTSSAYYQPVRTDVVSLSLLPFACSSVSISYSVVSKQGATVFSTPTEICVNEGLPGPPEDLFVRVVGEDLRPGFLRHAILNVSWNKPQSDLRGIQFFSLSFESAEERSSEEKQYCRDQQNLHVMIPKDNTSYLVNATDGELTTPPAFDCYYKITMRSHPGQGEEVIGNYQVKFARQKWLSLSCEARFNLSTAKYDFIGRWEIPTTYILPSDVIASSIEHYTIQLQKLYNNIFDGTSILDTRAVPLKGNTLQFEYVFYERDPLHLDEGNYKLIVKPTVLPAVFWRKIIVSGRDDCTEPAPPRMPSPVENIMAINLTFFESNNSIQFHLTWTSPTYPNGEILQFELHVSTDVIPPATESLQNVLMIRRIITNGTQNKYFFTTFLPLFSSTNTIDTLFLQIRSMNEYKLYSNWSEPLLLNISESRRSTDTVTPTVISREKLPVFSYPLFGVAGILLLVLIAIIIGAFYHKFCFHRGLNMGPDWIPTMNLKDKVAHTRTRPKLSIIDHWELYTDEVTISESERLGIGCFGVVYKGVVRQQSTRRQPLRKNQSIRLNLAHTVAVKQLKDYATGSEKASFLKEIDMMKKVSGTENELSRFVVNMVGCVTEREPLLLVLEYVKYGDLLTYLRSMRNHVKLQEEVNSGPVPYLEPNGVYSKLTPVNEKYAELGDLKEKDLLEFARQIAAGMEFLSGLGVLHRDLACRNILIGDKKNLKISDFGMSRYVPGEEVYVITSKGLLPLRWMATESLFHRQFTSASDVWSYGITLWEICTLGGFPYNSLSNRELTQVLKQGYRLEKPLGCSDEVYEIMIQCWHTDPEDRPKFLELRSRFDQFRSIHTQEQYPYMELLSSCELARLQTACADNREEVISLDEDITGDSAVDGFNLQLLLPGDVESVHSFHSTQYTTGDSEPGTTDYHSDFRYVPSPVGTSYSSTIQHPEFPVMTDSEKRLFSSNNQGIVNYMRVLTTYNSRIRSHSASPPALSRAAVTLSLPDVTYRETEHDEEHKTSKEWENEEEKDEEEEEEEEEEEGRSHYKANDVAHVMHFTL